MSAATVRRGSEGRLHRTSREALSALAVQFLLGMGANLIGPPTESTRVVGAVVLGLHVLVGVGLIVVGVRVLLAARREGVARPVALWALVATAVAFLSGIAMMIADSEWFSFLMAAGWLASAALYVAAYAVSGRTAAAAT